MGSFKNLLKILSFLAAFLVIGWAVAGCGSSEEKGGNPDSGPGGGAGGTTGFTGGTGGTAVTGGTGGTATGGTGGTTAACPGPFTGTCGATACADLSSASAATSTKYGGMACVASCCTADQQCGSQLQGASFGAMFITGTTCMPLDQPGTLDTACDPSLTPPGADGGTTTPGIGSILQSFFQLQGCCTPDGKCGVMVSDLGMGCVANENLGGISTIFAGGVAAKACTP